MIEKAKIDSDVLPSLIVPDLSSIDHAANFFDFYIHTAFLRKAMLHICFSLEPLRVRHSEGKSSSAEQCQRNIAHAA
jgi:hypothetical protein